MATDADRRPTGVRVAEVAASAVARIRKIYADAGVDLDADRGLGRTVDEVEKLGLTATTAAPRPPSSAVRRVRWAVGLAGLADELTVCTEAGRDLRHHLKNMRHGDFELGAQSAAEHRITLKDYWYEVRLLASLLRQGINADFGPPGDPVADIVVGGGLVLQAKHPASPRQLPKTLRKFCHQLGERGQQGLFCVGLEDVLRCGVPSVFRDQQDFSQWCERKWDAANVLLDHLLPLAAGHAGLLGFVLTCRVVPKIASTIKIEEFGGCVVFDREGTPQPVLDALVHLGNAVAGRTTVLPKLIRTLGENTLTIRQQLIRLTTPTRSRPWKVGDRVGLYRRCNIPKDSLGAFVFECISVNPDGPIFELAQVAGAARSSAEIDGLQHDLMLAIQDKGGDALIALLPDAREWLRVRGLEAPVPLR